MDTNEVRLLTVKAAAKRMSLSDRSVWRMIATRGALPGVVRLAGRTVRIDREILDLWLSLGAPKNWTPPTATASTATGTTRGITR